MLMLGPFAAFPALSAYCTVSLLGAFEGMNREAPAHAGSNLQQKCSALRFSSRGVGRRHEILS